MTRFTTSRPDHWTAPRPVQDPSMRLKKHGKIQPMDEDRGFWSRLFERMG